MIPLVSRGQTLFDGSIYVTGLFFFWGGGGVKVGTLHCLCMCVKIIPYTVMIMLSLWDRQKGDDGDDHGESMTSKAPDQPGRNGTK